MEETLESASIDKRQSGFAVAAEIPIPFTAFGIDKRLFVVVQHFEEPY